MPSFRNIPCTRSSFPLDAAVVIALPFRIVTLAFFKFKHFDFLTEILRDEFLLYVSTNCLSLNEGKITIRHFWYEFAIYE